MSDKETLLLNDDVAEALERAGLWRRAARRWLYIFDLLESDWARERIALRREACLLMAGGRGCSESAAKRSTSYRKLAGTRPD